MGKSGGDITVVPRYSGSRVEVGIRGLSRTVWLEWRGPEGVISAAPVNDNYALLAALPVAMARGSNLHVCGSVDSELLAGAERYSRIWSQWIPSRYKPVHVTADRELEMDNNGVAGKDWLYPLSGGVDSLFAVHTNLSGRAGRDNRKPGAVFLVRGLDYPLTDNALFPRLEQQVEKTARVLNLPLLICETNWKDFCIQYEWDTLLALAAIAHTMAGSYAGAAVAADFTYGEDLKAMPWGNAQYLPHLLSSSHFQVVGSGAESTRIEKLRYLSEIPEVLSRLAVCQRPSNREGRMNCGKCEKCIRTAMGLIAATGDMADVFAERPNLPQVARLGTLSPIEMIFWRDILRQLPAQMWPMRLVIGSLIARSRIANALTGFLQPLEKKYIRPAHHNFKRRIGAVPPPTDQH